MRRPVALLLALPLFVACGGGDERSALETVQLAAEASSDDTFAFEGTITTSEGMFKDGFDFEGTFDTAARLASAEMDAGQFGLPGVDKVDAVLSFADGYVVYVRLPPALLAGAPPALADVEWMSIDLQAMAEQAGVSLDFESLLQGTSQDPTSGLQFLRGAKTVTEIGTEEIRGVETTQYEAVIDLDKAVAEAPAEVREALAGFVDLYTARELEVAVWIDDDGRVRRYETTQDLSKIKLPEGVEPNPQFPLRGTMSLQYEYFDFGTEADIEVPAGDEVVDILDLMEAAGVSQETFTETGQAIN